MELSERLGWMLLGMAIGFVLGFIVARLRAIEEKVDIVDEHVTSQRNERGFMRIPIVADALYILALVIVVWGAVAAQQAVNKIEQTQACIKQYNERQGDALRGRDSSVKAGTQSEIDLWTKYNHLYEVAKKDPKRIPALQDTLNKAIMVHRTNLEELQETRENNAYPDPDIIKNCEDQDE